MYSISSKIWSVLPNNRFVFPKSYLFFQKSIHFSRFWSIFQKFSNSSASFLSVLSKSGTFLQKIDQFTQNLILTFIQILINSSKNRSIPPKSNPFFQKQIHIFQINWFKNWSMFDELVLKIDPFFFGEKNLSPNSQPETSQSKRWSGISTVDSQLRGIQKWASEWGIHTNKRWNKSRQT